MKSIMNAERPFGWVLFVSLFLTSAAALSAIGQTLQAHPGAVTGASPGFKARAEIVLQNETAQRLSGVSLSNLNNDGIAVDLKNTKRDAAAKGELDWPVELTIPPSAHLPGSIVFRADYKANGIAKAIYTAIDVRTDGPQKPVEVALDGATEPISQQRPGVLNLVVTNNLDVEVEVTAKPQAVAGGLIVGSIGQWTVSRHSVSARPIDLTTGFRVTPGSQNVVLDVDTRWTRDGQTDKRHFALTKSVTVGVFFESEILKALSVPSFLALPGCLFLFTLQFLLSSGLLGVKNQSNIPSLPVTSPGFWVISLSLSALFVLLYYAFTGVNCLLTYGIGDIGIIWISSILSGLAAFVTYALLRRRWIRDHVITASDTPKDLLTKICRNHLSLLRPGVKFKLNGVEVSGLVVETMAEGQTLAWVSPHIQVEWKPGTTREEQETAQNSQTKFNRIINGNRDPEELVKVLDEAGILAIVRFESTAVFPGPYHLKIDAITGPAAEQLLVG